MFAQMCEAMATCHGASVFHRDIKPENFIVTDGWTFNQDGLRERKVVVKLSDFGLSTCDDVLSDMDCGSAPYMSFGTTPILHSLYLFGLSPFTECRNNVAPVYKPRAADVWSLGTVLMYVFPFCFSRSSFTCVISCRLYHYNPWMDTATGECSSFELYRSNPTNFFMRRFAGMTLPVANFLVENVFCILDDPTDDSQRIGTRVFGVWIRDLPTLLGSSQLSTHTYTHSRVPSTASISCHLLASAPASRRPVSRQASLAGSSPCWPQVVLRVIYQSTVGRVLDHDRPRFLLRSISCYEEDEDEEQQPEPKAEYGVRSLFTTKRRKRGRMGKGMTPLTDHTQTSKRLALTSQTLVCELSRQTRSTLASNQSFLNVPPAQPVPVSPTITKKQSRWKLPFGKSGGETTTGTRSDSCSTHSNSTSGSARATNVTNLIMGLNRTTPTTRQLQPPPVPPLHLQSTLQGCARGHPDLLSLSQQRRWALPTSTRSGRPLANRSSSTTSSNWRNSISSTNMLTSTSMRYSNQRMGYRCLPVSASSAHLSTTGAFIKPQP
jgi:serine/threonine protein kinase